MLDSFFHWLDGDPTRFRVALWGTFALAAAMALGRVRGPRWWNAAPLFTLALLLALFAHRWTVALDGQRHGNPDETQIVSDALTYASDPVPFRSVDGNTSGPLNPLTLLTFARIIGRPIDLIAARLYGVLCLFALLLATWRVLAVVTTETRARLLTLPTLPIIGGAYNFDLMQFNNEHPPVAWLALALWALSPLLDETRPLPRWRLAVGALLIGAAPLAKPQVAPMTLWAAGVGLVLLLRHPPTRPGKLGAFALYAALGVLPAIAVFGTCFAAGAWSDMWQTFITNNLQYVGHRHFQWHESPGEIVRLVHDCETLSPAFWAMVGAGVVTLGSLPWTQGSLRRLGVVALGGYLIALLAVVAPGKHFQHYVLLSLQPGCLLLGVATVVVLSWADARPRRRLLLTTVWAGWLLAVLAPTPWRQRSALPLRYGEYGQLDSDVAPVLAVLRRYTQPGEPLAVWGWSPWIYVWAQQPHAPREANSQRQLEGWGDVDYYRRRWAADITRLRPTVFVDAAGPSDFTFKDRGAHSHERFFDVLRVVGLQYQFVEEVRDLRIYVRRDRLPAAELKFDERARGLRHAHPPPDYFAGMEPSNMGIGEVGEVSNVHAPCLLVWEPRAGAQHAQFGFGLNADAYTHGHATDGVVFTVFGVHPDGREETLFHRALDPVNRPEDRGLQQGEARIPAGVRLVFETGPGPARSNNFDWAYWKEITLTPAR